MTITFDRLYHGDKKPRFHGNGFIQLYAGEHRRLHVWHPSLKPIRDHNATIHNHRYDVRSRILHGTLRHTTYKAVPNPNGDYQVNHVTTSKFEDGSPIPTAERCNLLMTGQYDMVEGTEYAFPHPYLHTSDTADGEMVITIFDQINVQPREVHPVVISPVGCPPTHAFDPETAPDEQKLWDAIFDACRTREGAIKRWIFP